MKQIDKLKRRHQTTLTVSFSEAYLGPRQTSIAKSSTTDVWQGPKYASGSIIFRDLHLVRSHDFPKN